MENLILSSFPFLLSPFYFHLSPLSFHLPMNCHEELAQMLFTRICEIIKVKNIQMRAMNRRGSKSNKNYTLGYINLKTRTIVLDIYTPKTMKPKSLNSLIRTLCHEIAHLQKPPYRQFHRGKWIVRQHYPAFYRQVERNIEKVKKDSILAMHFRN